MVLRAVISGGRRWPTMTLLQNHHIQFLTSHWKAHFRGDWRRTLEVAFSMVPCTLLQKFFLLSDHLGRNDRCTHWILSRESSVLVRLRPHSLPGQVSADSESLPQGTWGSLWGEDLSSTPETTHPLIQALPDLPRSPLHTQPKSRTSP